MESSASGQSPRVANSSITSSGNGIENEQCVIDIPLLNGCCIRKVPLDIRKLNTAAYTPVITIGPYHPRSKFPTVENMKRNCSMSFMRRVGNDIDFENIETTIQEMVDIIRPCYANTFQLEGDRFVTRIVSDAIFILELFLSSKLDVPGRQTSFGRWRTHNVHRELVLLENQLPFFVIEKLYHLALPTLSNSLSLTELTFDFFKKWNIRQKAPEGEIKHFTDLLRFFALPQRDELPPREPRIRFPKYSATQLREAGVKFEVIKTKFVPDLSFKGGVLGIPVLSFEDDTEVLVLNILALEQCCYTEDKYITDFYLILGRLIRTDNDVRLLCEEGIISDSKCDDNDITSMVKNFTRGISSFSMSSNLLRVCEELNAFCDDPWNRRKAFFRRRYWGAVSASAIILVALTLLQTVCSVIQMVPIVRSL